MQHRKLASMQRLRSQYAFQNSNLSSKLKLKIENRTSVLLLNTMMSIEQFGSAFEDDEDDEIHSSKVSCDTIRRKITMFLATKEMTLTAFLLAIGGVNHNSYGNFMKLKGRDGGSGNGTYWGALNFFARRDKEAKEVKKQAKIAEKETGKKRKVPEVVENEGSNKAAKPEVVVELPDDLPVYDDCDEVRTKISQCIQSPGMTQAKFARNIGLTPGEQLIAIQVLTGSMIIYQCSCGEQVSFQEGLQSGGWV